MHSHVRCCPVCGEKDYDVIFHRDFSSLIEIVPFERYNVCLCNICGMAYADFISNSNLNEYYEEMSKYEIISLEKLELLSKQKNYEVIKNLFKKMNVPTEAKILDIGCGSGILLYKLKQVGYCNLKGLDPSEHCRNFALKFLDIDIMSGEIGDEFEEKYDVILLEAVLEHIVDVDGAIKYCKKMLNDNGILYIGVPNIADFSDDLYQEFSVEHINFFSKISLKNCLSKNGFSKIVLDETHECKEIFSCWKSNKKITQQSIVLDRYSRNTLNKYIYDSSLLLKNLKDKIKNIDYKFILWGVGTHTATLFSMANLKMDNIVVFVDSNQNYHNKNLSGKTIISPLELEKYPDYPILISSKNAQRDIQNYIKEKGLPNKIFTLYEV